MENIKVNPGAIIGAVLCSVIVGAFIHFVMHPSSPRPYQLAGIALVFGAIAGNTLWALMFKQNLKD